MSKSLDENNTWSYRVRSCRGQGLLEGDLEAALQEIAKIVEKKGCVKPGDIIERSRFSSSVFNPYIEKSDRHAAKCYRRQQARTLVQSIVLASDSNPDLQIPAFVTVRTTEGGEKLNAAMVPMTKVLTNPFMLDDYLKRGMKRLEGFAKSYEHVKEFRGVIREIRALGGPKKSRER